MTIDEAIRKEKTLAHLDELASEIDESKIVSIYHKQLAEWLEKLKAYEESLTLKKEYYAGYAKGFNDGCAKFSVGQDYNDGYNEAIDDFVNAVDKQQQEDWISNLEYGITFSDIEQIAEKLKKVK